ncbi:MAG: DUF3592 domain-containing protein [Clostridia bacterium]|nr:DUF3592 domain-containing protein [Clostridia bacterium]
MGKKKKKRIQTEKERLFQEEAARKRAERAEAARKNRRRNAVFFLAAALLFFCVSAALFGVHVARMRNYELNYVQMLGTITDYEVHHNAGSNNTNRYTLVISYTFKGEDYSFNDTAAYDARPDEMIGKNTTIYVNPNNPERAKKATTADDICIPAVFVFAFSLPTYIIGMGLVSEEKKFGFLKRILCMWLPVFATCVLHILLCWVGFPNSSFWTAYLRTDGAIGYTVLAGLALVGAAIDGAITKRFKPKLIPKK